VTLLVFLLDFGTVPTVWHFLFSIGLWNCFDSVVLLVFYWTLELFRKCDFIFFYIGLWNCSYSVALLIFLLDFGIFPTVRHYLFFY